MYATGDLKRGIIVDLDGDPCVVEAVSISTPTARGGNTIHRVKLRNLKTKQRVDKNFRGGDMIKPADVERRPVQFLYKDTQAYHFMDQESYEQFQLDAESLEWESNFLIDDMEGIKALMFNESPIGIELPNNVSLKVTETAPGVKGNSATGRTKPAIVETGFELQVPEHIDLGVSISVDTRTGGFLGRTKS